MLPGLVTGVRVALALAAAPSSSATSPAPAAPAQLLTADSFVERDMAAEDTHLYQIVLHAGDYLQVLVEQRGVDVAVTVSGPDGAAVLETDSPCGPIGPEPIAFVAAADGVHELALKAGEIAVPPRGRYEMRVEASRPPTPVDRTRVEAVRAGADARHAAGKPLVVLEKSRHALGHWQALGDRRMQMWTELKIGFTEAFELDDPPSAEKPYREALTTAVELGDEWAEARISDDLAQVLIRLGRMDETRALMERALALSRAAGRKEYVARMFTVLGSFFSFAGEPQAALERLYEALEVYQASANERDQARTRLEIGATYLRLDDPELALQHYELALPVFASDPGRRARCLTELGVARLKLGDRAGARGAYEEALGIYRTLENRIGEADTLIALGDLRRDEGDLREALQSVAAALDRYRARAYPLGVAFAQCRMGDIQRRLGDAPAARAAFAEIVELGARAGANSAACAQRGLARLEASAGSLDAARRHAEAALEQLESLRSLASPRSRATALASRQSVYEVLIDVLMRAHERQPSAGHDSEALDVSEQARARSLLDLLSEGRVDLSRGVRPELLSEERSLHQRLNAAAVAQGRARAAGRAFAVEELDREFDRLSAALADAESRIRTTSPQYASLTQARPLTLGAVRTQVLDSDTQLVQYALGETGSYVWVVSTMRLESFRLAPRAAIEEAALRLRELLSAAPAAGADPSALKAAQRELGRLILGPLARALDARRLLVVAPGALQYVPFGALSLRDDKPLLADFELVGAPSASVIATLREAGRSRARAGKAVAIFADPVFEASDPRLANVRPRTAATPVPLASRDRALGGGSLGAALRGVAGRLARLPFSRREADAIAALAGSRASLKATGFEASRSAATSPGLADYRIVHFATHGVLNTRRPELSGVVLSLFDAAGQGQDGFLRLHDIYNLSLGADLVVLSGCQTGLGKDLKGEGLIGLTRGFMFAGAPTVVASLWQVDDESTAELMKRFYRGMLREGRRPGEALRSAQLEMAGSRRWSAPFYWAGFVVQGEWR
jgi:CHAT domain-containing protein